MLGPTVAALALLTASGPPIVAVFDIEDRGARLKSGVISNLTDYLSAKLTASGAYHVIPNDEVRGRLRGQKAESYKSCYDQSCQIEIGKELAAGKSISTKLLRIGKTCVVTVSVYDLASAATEHAATQEGKCSEEGVMASISKAVETLVGPRTLAAAAKKLAREPPPPPPPPPAATPTKRRDVWVEYFANNAHGWNSTSGKYYAASLGSREYWMQVKNDRCSIETVPLGLKLPNNFDVTWMTTWRSGVDNSAYGLVLGESKKDYYFFAASGNGWTFAGQYLGGDHIDDPMPWNKHTAHVGKGKNSNRHLLEVRGNRMTYYTNGKQLMSKPLQRVDIRGGQIGWSVCSQQRAAISALVVTEVP